MPDYKGMYLTLFRATTKAISALQQAQQRTEELYMASSDANHLIVLDMDEPKEEQPSQG